jgi:glycosyltransferase involved in cell wall biosynthesis
MKIAYVKDAVYPWEKGGAQKRTWEIASRLADDHDVHIYGMHYWDGPSVIEREGVTLHGVCEPYDLYTNGRRSISQSLKFTQKLLRPLLAEKFDVVDCQKSSYFPFYPSKLNQIRHQSVLVGTWTEVWDEYWDDYLGHLSVFGKAVEKMTIRVPDVIVPISEYVADELRRIGRSGGLDVVHNGVDFNGIQDVDPADADWDAIYVGRLSKHKRIETLLRSIKHLETEHGRTVNCCVIGDGPEYDRLVSLAKNLCVDDRVTFKGFVEEDETVYANMKAADVFVLPSVREGFPNTILEANACGIPAVLVHSDANGGAAIVEDGRNGYVVDKNASAIADQIATVLDDYGLQAELAESCLAFAKEHDWETIASETTSVYERATAEHR